jgi:hypothetical protein
LAQKIDVNKQFKLAEQQYQRMLAAQPDTSVTVHSAKPDGTYRNMPSSWWCSGFFPGGLWQLYERSKDPQWEKAARLWTAAVKKEQYNTGTHDLGLESHHLISLIFIACFALVINFSREVIKDIQDMEGDKLRNVRSIPLVFGIEKARWIATGVTLLLIPIYLIGIFLGAFSSGLEFNILFMGALLLSMSILILQLLKASEKSMNLLLKLSLLLGSTSIYFL